MRPEHLLAVAAALIAAGLTAGHALLHKRDPRAAWGWIAVCLMFPLAGAALYLLFGINRIHTRARQLEREAVHGLPGTAHGPLASDRGGLRIPPEYGELVRVSDAVTGRPLSDGNRIELLHNGEEAYPPMLAAIEAAERSLYLSSYIFDTDRTGRRFIAALSAAAGRGVDVRVLVDGVGGLYSWPRASTLLRRGGVRAERFLPPRLVPPSLAINLRNHRKILVADGRVGFTGGMNLGDRHLATDTGNPARVVDTHFRLTGPVVAQLAEVFLADWAFVTGERTPPPEVPAAEAAAPERPPEPTGAVTRTLVDGPNEDLDKLLAVLVGAVSAAHHRVSVMTPYFLPPPSLASALEAAALRGVAVTVILPARNNLPYIQWATRHALPELLRRGVRVFYQPPPFVHTKLFEVDAHYAQIGSANLDPRSLRLNFELAVEVYDRTFAGGLAVVLDQARERSAEITLRQIEGRSLAVRGRDALAWLFSPYL